MTDKTIIQKYIEEQDAAIQPRLLEVYETISSAIPDAEERLSWGMPTFWKGRNIMHFAPAKRHIGLYPGSEAIVAFADKLKEYKTSKGTVQLPNSRDLPLDLQAGFLRALDAGRKLGITANESSLLIPCKSVTAVIGLSEKPQGAKIRGCGYCSLRETCEYRKEGTEMSAACGR